jgi:hypothetical protein
VVKKARSGDKTPTPQVEFASTFLCACRRAWRFLLTSVAIKLIMKSFTLGSIDVVVLAGRRHVDDKPVSRDNTVPIRTRTLSSMERGGFAEASCRWGVRRQGERQGGRGRGREASSHREDDRRGVLLLASPITDHLITDHSAWLRRSASAPDPGCQFSLM